MKCEELHPRWQLPKIAKTLEKRNMSQKEFSRILGKRPSEISKWLSGKHNFTTDTLSDIEHALDIHLLDNREEVAFESTINHRITIEVKPSRKNMFIPQYEQESYSYNYDLVSSHNLLYN